MKNLDSAKFIVQHNQSLIIIPQYFKGISLILISEH